jgi:ribosome-associated protein
VNEPTPTRAAPAPTGVLRVNRSCAIALDELEWRFSASGGAGGQNVNTSNTKADVRFDIAGSPSLSDRHRERLTTALGDSVRVVASDRRSQLQNRELALERLRAKLAEALVVPKHRVATKPSKGAKKRRVETKRKRSDVKRTRQRPASDD